MGRNFDDETEEKTIAASSETFLGKMQAADAAPPTLVVLIGPPGYQGKQWALGQAETIIGRSIDCPMFIDDKSLSRSHARFVVSGGDVSVIDMGSTNKTKVNGDVLTPLAPVRLKNNDQIQAGNVVLKFLERGSIEVISSQQLQERVAKDALTGAYTKAELLNRGPELMKRSETLGEPLCLVMFDIDHFKKINDTYGHPAGDHVLREIGQIVGQKLVRANDYFARFGGEEFVILLSGSPTKAAMDVAERVRNSVQSHLFVFDNKTIPVTVSLGVAERQPTDKSWETILARADEALYKSKNAGRNRTTLAA